MVIVVAVISSIFNLMGLIGAIKENFCLSRTYTILSVLSAIVDLVSSLRTSYNWGIFVFSLLATVVSVLFTCDLYTMRKARQQPRVYA